MPTMRFQVVIHRSCEAVYQTLTDLAGYDSWLTGSRLYNHTRLTSGYPVRVGTTYVDIGSAVAMQGKVVELEPNKVIAFQQATQETHAPARVLYISPEALFIVLTHQDGLRRGVRCRTPPKSAAMTLCSENCPPPTARPADRRDSSLLRNVLRGRLGHWLDT